MDQLELVFWLLVSPIHVPPVRHVHKHCGVHIIDNIYNIYYNTCM